MRQDETRDEVTMPLKSTPLRVALTGAAGHLGSLVLNRLVMDEAVGSIHAIDLAEPFLASRKSRHFRLDISDADALQGALAGCDAAIHMAFNVDRPDRPAQMHATNVGGSSAIAQACRDARVGKLVWISSGAAYGFAADRPERVDEAQPIADTPDFLYASHKWASEKAVGRIAAETPDMALTILRPAICIGPYAKTAFAQLMRARTIVCVDDTPLQVLWDEDLAEAVMAALHAPATGAFNVGAAEPLRYSEIAERMDARLRKVPAPLALASIHAKNVLARLGLARAVETAWVRYAARAPDLVVARARDELGWTPAHATCAEVLRHFGATVPHARARTLRRWVGALAQDARAPEGSQAATNLHLNLHLTGLEGGDLHLDIGQTGNNWATGRQRGAHAFVRAPLDLFMRTAAGEMDAAEFTANAAIWADEPARVQEQLQAALTGVRYKAGS